MTVRQVEDETSVSRPRKPREPRKTQKAAHVDMLEKSISRHLGTRVCIEEKRGGKGKMVIEFYSHEEFERLAAMMNIPLPR
jgi:hypothetical protein